MNTIDSDALAVSLRRFDAQGSGLLLDESLQGVIDACVNIFGVDGSGLMLADDHSGLHYVVASTQSAKVLEKVQLETGEGPCVDSFVHGELVATDDVTADPRWPSLRSLLAGHGIGAVLGVPVHLAGVCVGSLNVYRSESYAWNDSERDAIGRFREVAEAMIRSAVNADHAGVLAGQLTYALEYRVPIERGVGFLMARDGLSDVEAFTLLRAASRNTRVKIGDVATALLESGRLPGE